MTSDDLITGLLIIVFASAVAIGCYALGGSIERSALQVEAIERGYGKMVLVNPTDRTAVFKWDDEREEPKP